MGKNNKLINNLRIIAARNRMENVKAAADDIMPQIYSGIIIALWDLLEGDDDSKSEDINEVIVKSQEIWTESVMENKDIVQMCIDKTGFDIRTSKSLS